MLLRIITYSSGSYSSKSSSSPPNIIQSRIAFTFPCGWQAQRANLSHWRAISFARRASFTALFSKILY